MLLACEANSRVKLVSSAVKISLKERDLRQIASLVESLRILDSSLFLINNEFRKNVSSSVSLELAWTGSSRSSS